MIGMSLSFKHLLATDDPALQPETLLPKLWAHGVRSIELRSIPAGTSAADVFTVANLLWDFGFQITVHGSVRSLEGAVRDVFDMLTLTLANLRQRDLVITVHPIADDNVLMLNLLADYIELHHLRARIALENKRLMPSHANGDSVAHVLDAVTRANRKSVGICFDMGHLAWFAANFTDTPNMLPPKEFLVRVIHTHIHAYTEGKTHFPLEEWREPISTYIDALGFRYFGVYNVELTPSRFKHRCDATHGYLASADTLRQNYPARVAYHDELRATYDGCFRRALEVFDKKQGCYGTMISTSSYLFSTNGYKWAMDVSFLSLYQLAQTPSRVKEYLSDIDCMILTHAHGDHAEERTIRALADTDILWIVPAFLVDRVVSFGVKRERIVSVCPGDTLNAGPLSITVLEGRHFRTGTRSGAEAVGYLIAADKAPTLAFPGDVRDYVIADDAALNADHCFAHVWLTDHALEPEKYVPKSREFANFMLHMSQKSIFLTHLNVNREDSKRWTLHHACVAKNAIKAQSPETVVRVPRYGEIFDLSQ